jgi:hybrid cluster-associated redox disulfide protein
MEITKDMTFAELIQNNSNAGPILAKYGMHCIGCRIGVTETIEQGVKAHGYSDEVLDKILSELKGS